MVGPPRREETRSQLPLPRAAVGGSIASSRRRPGHRASALTRMLEESVSAAAVTDCNCGIDACVRFVEISLRLERASLLDSEERAPPQRRLQIETLESKLEPGMPRQPGGLGGPTADPTRPTGRGSP